MIRFLVEKEFKQILRNPFLPRLIILFPCMMMLLMPWAADFEIRNINLSVVDNDGSTYSRRMVRKADASDYFRLVNTSGSYDEAMQSIEKGEADLILEIPPKFEENLIKEGHARIMISANTVNGTKGGLGSSYLASIAGDFAGEIRAEQAAAGNQNPAPGIRIVTQNRFNPHLNYKVYMVPALMTMLLTMLCGFLPSLNIVGEKEAGTIEQINVTPVGKYQFILAKLIPYWIMGLLILSLCFVLARFIYGISPVGSLGTIYFFACLYILVTSGVGLVISNYSSTMQQAMFVMYFFLMIFILMSGLLTPVSSMPGWAQVVAMCNPLTYFNQVMRMVYLKGSTIGELIPQLIALVLFATALNTWAVLSYKKKS